MTAIFDLIAWFIKNLFTLAFFAIIALCIGAAIGGGAQAISVMVGRMLGWS